MKSQQQQQQQSILSTYQMESLKNEIKNDEILNAMMADPISSQFAYQRINEIVAAKHQNMQQTEIEQLRRLYEELQQQLQEQTGERSSRSPRLKNSLPSQQQSQQIQVQTPVHHKQSLNHHQQYSYSNDVRPEFQQGNSPRFSRETNQNQMNYVRGSSKSNKQQVQLYNLDDPSPQQNNINLLRQQIQSEWYSEKVSLTGSMHELQKKLEQKDIQIRSKDKEIAALNVNLSTLESQVASLEERHTKQLQEIQGLLLKNQQLQELHDSIKDQHDIIIKQSKTEMHKNAMEQMSSHFNQIIGDLKEKVAKYKNHSRELEDQNQKYTTAIQTLYEQSQTSGPQQLKDMEKQNRSLESRVIELERELQAMHQSHAQQIESLKQEQSVREQQIVLQYEKAQARMIQEAAYKQQELLQSQKMHFDESLQHNMNDIDKQYIHREVLQQILSDKQANCDSIVDNYKQNEAFLKLECERIMSQLQFTQEQLQEKEAQGNQQVRSMEDQLVQVQLEHSAVLNAEAGSKREVEESLAESQRTVAHLQTLADKLHEANFTLQDSLQHAEGQKDAKTQDVIDLFIQVNSLYEMLKEIVSEQKGKILLRNQNNANTLTNTNINNMEGYYLSEMQMLDVQLIRLEQTCVDILQNNHNDMQRLNCTVNVNYDALEQQSVFQSCKQMQKMHEEQEQERKELECVLEGITQDIHQRTNQILVADQCSDVQSQNQQQALSHRSKDQQQHSQYIQSQQLSPMNLQKQQPNLSPQLQQIIQSSNPQQQQLQQLTVLPSVFQQPQPQSVMFSINPRNQPPQQQIVQRVQSHHVAQQQQPMIQPMPQKQIISQQNLQIKVVPANQPYTSQQFVQQQQIGHVFPDGQYQKVFRTTINTVPVYIKQF